MLPGTKNVQCYRGYGTKLVRDIFKYAKEKSPCINFIDEIDAIGSKRFDSEDNGDREFQITLLELLNQLDGFNSDDGIKVIAATNRVERLDPALMRSGRFDREIDFPHPSEEARVRILQVLMHWDFLFFSFCDTDPKDCNKQLEISLEIHSRKMDVHPDVDFEELARSTDDFNGAQLKAFCVEAGMLALHREADEVNHEDYNEGIIQVQAKNNASLNYCA